MTNCLPDSLSLEVGLAWLVKAHPQSGGHCSQWPATVCPLRVPGPYCPIHSSAGYTGASLAPLLPSAHSFSALLIPTLYPHRWCAPHWLLPIHHPGLDPRTTSLESFSGATQYPTPVVLKVWSPEQQQQCHLTTCLQYKLLSPTTRPLLSQRHWERGLVVCLNLKSNRWFWYTLEFEKHYCVYVYVYMLCLHMYTALLPISHLKLLFNFLIDRPYLPKIQAPRKFMFTPICSMIRTVSDTQSVFNKYWLNKWIYKGINLVPFSPRSSKVLFCFVLLSSRKERGASQVTLLLKKKPACKFRRHKRSESDPWVRKIPRRRAWQPTPVFLPGESQEPGRLQSTGTQRVGHDWSELAPVHAERREHVHRGLPETFSENNTKIQSDSHKPANSGSSEGSLFTCWTCLAHINVR